MSDTASDHNPSTRTAGPPSVDPYNGTPSKHQNVNHSDGNHAVTGRNSSGTRHGVRNNDLFCALIQKYLMPIVKGDSEFLLRGRLAEFQFWTKQFLGIVMGIVCGLFGVSGIIGFAVVGVVGAGICVSIYNRMEINDDVMDLTEALQEGGTAGLMTFALAWILTHTVMRC